jgi:hypothetical protein
MREAKPHCTRKAVPSSCRRASRRAGTVLRSHCRLSPELRLVQRISMIARASRRRAGFDDQTAGRRTPITTTIAMKAIKTRAHRLARARLPMESPVAPANRRRFNDRGQPWH